MHKANRLALCQVNGATHPPGERGLDFDVIREDPVISQVKLIAEPWDLGDRGYQDGNFPVGWAEWNEK